MNKYAPASSAYKKAVKDSAMARYHAKVALGEIVTEAARRAKMVEEAKQAANAHEDAHIIAQARYWYPEY